MCMKASTIIWAKSFTSKASAARGVSVRSKEKSHAKTVSPAVLMSNVKSVMGFKPAILMAKDLAQSLDLGPTTHMMGTVSMCQGTVCTDWWKQSRLQIRRRFLSV